GYGKDRCDGYDGIAELGLVRRAEQLADFLYRFASNLHSANPWQVCDAAVFDLEIPFEWYFGLAGPKAKAQQITHTNTIQRCLARHRNWLTLLCEGRARGS